MKHFKKYFLSYTILPLLVLSFSASYYRFHVMYDFEVTYEGPCDPYTQSCFVYCEDEACIDPIYSSKIKRNAHMLESVCNGKSVIECESATFCKDDETGCSIILCDPEQSSECDSLSEADKEDESSTTESLEPEPNVNSQAPNTI